MRACSLEVRMSGGQIENEVKQAQEIGGISGLVSFRINGKFEI